MYIFPYNYLNKCNNIVIYGAGTVGKDYYSQLMSEEDINILWVDSFADSIIDSRVVSPDTVQWQTVDMVFVAINNKEKASEIRKKLVVEQFVKEDKIVWDIIYSEETVFTPNNKLILSFLGYVYSQCFSVPQKEIKCQIIGMPLHDVKRLIELLPQYRLILSSNSDLIFYGWNCAREDEYPLKEKSGLKVGFWSIEPNMPNYSVLDYSITGRYIKGKRNCVFNIFGLDGWQKCNEQKGFNSENIMHSKFCNFIYSNHNKGDGTILRQSLCRNLGYYRFVDCPGKVLNNVSSTIEPRFGKNWIKSKEEYIKKFKFTIAFENCGVQGYVTEKIIQPLLSGSIPIYWGAPDIEEYINKDSFINCNDYNGDIDAMIKRIIEIDSDDNLYREMLSAQPIIDSDYFYKNRKRLEDFLDNIVTKVYS